MRSFVSRRDSFLVTVSSTTIILEMGGSAEKTEKLNVITMRFPTLCGF